MQLITKVQVAPNNVDDNQLMAEALPNLKERTGVKIMITDGGYGGEAIDQALQDAKIVTLIQTAIRRAQTDSNQFSLSDFSFQQDEGGPPYHTHLSTGSDDSRDPLGAPLAGRQTSGTREIQGDLQGDCLRRHDQRAAHPMLPASQNKGRTGCKNYERRAILPIQTTDRFFC